jgi:uncharacterized membrane protein YfcA
VIWLAVPLGVTIGLSLGALGGGGSILTVPALVFVLGQDARSATTGSLLIVGITSLAGVLAHRRAGRVRVVQGVVFGLLGVAGSVGGSRLSTAVSPQVLLAAFSVLMLVVAAIMLTRSRRGGRGDGGDDVDAEPVITLRPFTCQCPRAAKVLVTATAVGLLTGFFGVGGGFAVVPALVLSLGFAMPVAVGTSLVVISVNSASALLARIGGGVSLDWPLIGAFTLAAVAGGLLGGRVASRVRPVTLTRAFSVLLVAVAAYAAVRSVPQLT